MDELTTELPPRTTLLRFPSKRGRPKKTRPRRDTGTPELTKKRQKKETTEALDLCLERNIITPQHHWCGVHLRWLYTLRHGAPGVRAIDPGHFGGREIKADDPEWRASREKEYNEAIIKLSDRGLAMTVLSLCVYNERPRFLKQHGTLPFSQRQAEANQTAMEDVIGGLELLSRLWRRL